jgi:hypothetical protein
MSSEQENNSIENNSAMSNNNEINNDLDGDESEPLDTNDLEIHVSNNPPSPTEPSIEEPEPDFQDAVEEHAEVNLMDHPLHAIIDHPLMGRRHEANQAEQNNNNNIEINDDLDVRPDADQAVYDDDLDIYFVNQNYAMSEDDEEEEEADMFATDDEDEEDETEEEDDFRAADEMDDYEAVQKPSEITYNRDLPSSHNYLGMNFQDVAASKNTLHESNDVIVIPLLSLPGNSYYENQTDNYVQLIPGQVMPIYFYSPLQTQVIRKRMTDLNPTVGFVLTEKSLKVSAFFFHRF